MHSSVLELSLRRTLAPAFQDIQDRKLLVLDGAPFHEADYAIKEVIAELGWDVPFIPGGYTGVLRPVDVSFNKPFKV